MDELQVWTQVRWPRWKYLLDLPGSDGSEGLLAPRIHWHLGSNASWHFTCPSAQQRSASFLHRQWLFGLPEAEADRQLGGAFSEQRRAAACPVENQAPDFKRGMRGHDSNLVACLVASSTPQNSRSRDNECKPRFSCLPCELCVQADR